MQPAWGFVLVICLALLRAAGPVLAAPSVPVVELTHLEGRDYVRLGSWAKAQGFELSWLKKDETLLLSREHCKITLTIDSREAQLNGVEVWLAFPVLARNGVLLLAQADLQNTFQPVLWPARSRAGGKIKSICLDPGHGGKDPGNRVGSNEEKQFTLLLAQELRSQLKRAGFKVSLTRSSDSFVDLPDRPETARRRKADLFVSLHFNSAENNRGSVQGSEVYCLTPVGANSTNAQGEGGDTSRCGGNRNNARNVLLAYQIQKALIHALSVEDRGVRRARFAVLREAAMPAVLVEAGFMSHPTEGKKIFTADYRRQIAQAITQGLLAYKRTVEGQ